MALAPMLGLFSLGATVRYSVTASLDTQQTATTPQFLSHFPELPHIVSQYLDLSTVGRLVQTSPHLHTSLRQYTSELELGVSGSAREYSHLNLGRCVRQYPRLRSLKVSRRSGSAQSGWIAIPGETRTG